MIIWSGWGILAGIIPVVCFLVTVGLISRLSGADYIATHSWPGAFGTLIGAALVWLAARKLNGPGRTLVDPATGQTVVLRRRNSLFFIPMQYWAYILVVVAIGMLFIKHNS